MRYLKQSTSVDVPIGPFLDEVDARTPRDGPDDYPAGHPPEEERRELGTEERGPKRYRTRRMASTK